MISDKEKLANRLHRITLDMDEALKYLDAHQELTTLTPERQPASQPYLMKALMGMAIISYCRGFTKSRTQGHAIEILDFKSLNISSQPWAIDMHKVLMDKRSQAVAHSDWKHHSTKLDVEYDEEMQHGGQVRMSSVPQYSDINHDDFKKLASEILLETRFLRYGLDSQIIAAAQPPKSKS